MRARLSPRLIMVLLACFGIGLAYRAILAPDVNKGERLVAMFIEHCAPFARDRKTPDPTGLEHIADVPGQELWADANSALSLEFDAESCLISDVLQPLAASDHYLMDVAVSRLIAQQFPELTSEAAPDHVNFDRYRLWTSHPEGNPERWAVQFYRPGAVAGDRTTTLRVGLPPE